MNVVRCLEADWSNDPVSTERDSFRFLTERPLASNIDYYAVPWADMINNGSLHLAQSLPPSNNLAFTVCQHINFAQIAEHIEKLKIDVLFTPHANLTMPVLGTTQIRGYPHSPINASNASGKKEILFSFVGATGTHWTRKIVSELQGGYIKARKKWHFWQSKQKKKHN